MPDDRCASCSAPIRWVKMTSGKPMPLDREPREDGNIILDQYGQGLVVGELFTKGRTAFVSHFSTCPHAKQHRRPRGRG